MAPSRCSRLGIVIALALGLAGAPARAADETLAEAQNTLLMLGYKPGKSDGNPRPQTTQALSDFQRANKLTVTGKADAETMAALRRVRDTKFSGTLGVPKADAAPRKIQVEPKPTAQPVDPVAAAPVEAAPGTRVLSGSTTLSSAAGIPPALFGGGAPGSTTPLPTAPGAATMSPGASQPERQPFLGIVSWSWALPFLGIPLFGFLWWYGMRRQTTEPETETAELNQTRREPSLEKAAPAAGRREPRL
jgi:hypothetical protein